MYNRTSQPDSVYLKGKCDDVLYSRYSQQILWKDQNQR